MSKTSLIFHEHLGGDINDIQLTSNEANIELSQGSSIVFGPSFGESVITGNSVGDALNNWHHLIIAGVTVIENKSDSNVVIINNEFPLEEIKQSSGGTICIFNNYTNKCKTNIAVESYGKVVLTGANLDINSVILGAFSSFHFAHDNTTYSIVTFDESDIIICEPHKLVDLAHFLSNRFANNLNPEINLSEVEALRKYESNKEVLNFLNGQHGINYDSCRINKYIAENALKLAGITKNLSLSLELKVTITESEIYNNVREIPLDLNIVGEIFSHLTLSDLAL